MKKLSISLIAVLAFAASSYTVSKLWNVVPEGVTVNFELSDEGTKGTFSGLKANIDFDTNDPSASKISASIDIATLNSGNNQKDKHLLSADFFDAAKHPTATFTSTF